MKPVDAYRSELLDKVMIGGSAQTAVTVVGSNTVSMASSVILLFDLLSILLAASFSTFVCSQWLGTLEFVPGPGQLLQQAAIVAAVLAPFILFDHRFGAAARRGQMPVLVRAYALRFTLFSAVLLALGIICQTLELYPGEWLAIWFVAGLMLTSMTRVVVAHAVPHLQRRGVLTEVIAVVGAGPVADRLIQSLRQTRPETIELLGIFDDKVAGATPGAIAPTGTVAQLIELGKTRKIDWILLTLPPTAEQRVLSIVQRLKALSVPIGLCPQDVGVTVPYRTIDYVGNCVPVSLLADRPVQRREALIKGAEEMLPRWIVTLVLLPVAVTEAMTHALVKFVLITLRQRAEKLTFQFDNFDLAGFTGVARRFGQERYGYVVTPNADHMIRLQDDVSFRALYAAASYILLDSRFLAHVMRFTKGLRLPVCTGSDLTEKIFADMVAPNDPLVLIGGSHEQARLLTARYGLRNLAHFNPPMGFIRDPKAVEECLRFVEAHSPFRFCLLAIGSPQQEVVAERLKTRGVARGLALCIGASINFLTGDERRAPVWMQRMGMEWLYRLMQAPGRMAKRYLIRGPRVFGLLRKANIVLRTAAVPMPIPLVVPARQPAALAASYGTGGGRLALAAQNNPPAPSVPSDSDYVPARYAEQERAVRVAI